MYDVMKAPASDYWIVTENGSELERFDTRGGAEQYLAKLLKEKVEWVETDCKSGGCRGLRKYGKGSPVTVQKGQEAHAMCNECFSR